MNLETFGQKTADDLREYIDKKYHGTMSWMQETETRRNHPNNLWPDAKSAIVMGLNYGPYVDPLISLKDKEKASISVYARNQDCLLYTSPSPRDVEESRMPSSA